MQDRTVRASIRGGRSWSAIGKLLSAWRRNVGTRRSLETLPDHLLDDIGVSREAALREARKPFWQL